MNSPLFVVQFLVPSEDNQPPPYDISMFNDSTMSDTKKPIDFGSDTEPSKGADNPTVPAPNHPPYPMDPPPPPAEKSDQEEGDSTGVDLDELTRRFHQLKK